MNRHQSFGTLAAGALYALANVVIFGACILATVLRPSQASQKNRWAILAAVLVILAFVGVGPLGALYTIAGIVAILGGTIIVLLVAGSRSMREVP